MSVRVVVSNPETGASYQVEAQADDFAGTAIGDEVDGGYVGLDGCTLEITGGSDDTGRPMRGDVEGQSIDEILIDGGTGFNPTRDGERRRVSVRGGEVGDATVQLNTKVVEQGGTDIEDALGEEEE
ncbi:MAG: small subunit ribosomal protein S6e [Methanobacteriota archaeon]|jgi:small subunit ribosomal protein S6e|uniref:Small ribosomal subunit protein eS6 n=1 Tax=Halorutilus salinus TaxID=2487751 RepID=A0A9Q4C2J9_9EURY|nr:30S ribosomal protein S6e [Halorutilus salinus]MCX2817780.1 30S ribosomal protein S6e [Halorutilus salinus]